MFDRMHLQSMGQGRRARQNKRPMNSGIRVVEDDPVPTDQIDLDDISTVNVSSSTLRKPCKCLKKPSDSLSQSS